MAAALWVLADAAEEGRKVVLSMLVTGLVFVAFVVLGDVLRHVGRRRSSKRTRVL